MNTDILPADDEKRFRLRDRGEDWLISWHQPINKPDGVPHGSAGICFTPERQVVLVSSTGGVTWEFPGGRPEGNESLRNTLDRELNEEACASVIDAALLGFVLGECISGRETGRRIVRSAWATSIHLNLWAPQHETTDRRLIDPTAALDAIGIDIDARPVYERWLFEALAWWS